MKHLLLKISAVLLIIIGCAVGYLFFGGDLEPKDIETTKEEDWIVTQDRINILLLGTDADFDTKSRTDTIILASLDTKQKKVSILSIPRDTRVNIPGFGYNKINAANELGGVELTAETLSDLLKVPIDYYVLTNFEGFKGIVDNLGGVEIDIEQNMKCRVYDGIIDLKKGLQRLDGEKALQYVRYRYDKLGDISRTQRQQKFLVALAREMIQAKNIVKLPGLIPQLNSAVETDLKLPQLVSLARDIENYDLDNITVQTLPGNFATIGGASYWVVDMEKTPQIVLQVFAGQNEDIIDTGVIVEQENNETPAEPPNDEETGQEEEDAETSVQPGEKDNPDQFEEPSDPSAELEVPSAEEVEEEEPSQTDDETIIDEDSETTQQHVY